MSTIDKARKIHKQYKKLQKLDERLDFVEFNLNERDIYSKELAEECHCLKLKRERIIRKIEEILK